MNTKTKAILILSLIVVATVATSLVFALQPTASAQTTQTTEPSGLPPFNPQMMGNGTFKEGRMAPGMFGAGMGPMGHGRGCGGPGPIQVSDEYIAKATDIAKGNANVTTLIDQGYNITSVHPIITTVVDGNGNVSQQATTAEVILQGTAGITIVTVDISQGTVTKITTLPAPPARPANCPP
jgi:hypothetical protein